MNRKEVLGRAACLVEEPIGKTKSAVPEFTLHLVLIHEVMQRSVGKPHGIRESAVRLVTKITAPRS